MKSKLSITFFLAPLILALAFFLIGANSGKQVNSVVLNSARQFSEQGRNVQPSIVPGVVMVKVKSREMVQSLAKASTITGLASLDAKLSTFGAISVEKAFRHKPIPRNSHIPDISRILKIQIPERLSPVMVARELECDPTVEYAEPVYMRRLLEVPDDPKYAQQKHLPQINAPQAWDVQKGDSTIIIGIVDTGVDYLHEDLAANVWTNALEANGVTGIDDDNNGFVDDIHGWDFGDNDNDPMDPPTWGHGTHCAGISCAVTNNQIGVAGISWNCEYMPVKALVANDEYGSIWDAFEGIVYAADNGADIISNSWAGSTFLQWEQEVINYAYGKGAVIVCAAGNDNGEIVIYPAAYQHAISVAAVSVNDTKTGYSNFGPWIDICAPGGSQGAWILSTIPGNKYEGGGGTSMATPVVAGVCGLVKSHHPNWTNDQIAKQVLLSADNIDALNPQYRNRLGHGRVNAVRALTDTILNEPDARLALLSAALSDSLYGNDNGVFDRGENIHLRCNIQNCSIGGATAATLRLSCASADVEIVNGTISPVSFPADTTLPFDFTIRIGDSAPAQVALDLILETSKGYVREETIGFTVGSRALLLIDNEFGYPNAGIPNVELFFRDILDQNNLLYGYWDTQRTEFPVAQTLQQFPIVVLSCSILGGLFSEQERNALRTYLDGGGNLFICGQDIGWILYKWVGTPETRAFMRDYLHAEYLANDSEDQEVKGVTGDPISSDMAFHVWQPGLIANGQAPDVIAPTAGASTIFTYRDGRAGAIKFAGAHKVVYLGFGLEAVDSYENTKIGDLSPVRTELFLRILNWLNFIEHEPLRTTENINAARPITARITSNVSDLESVTLFWCVQGETDFTSVPMVETTERRYAAQIPGPGAPATIEYYIQTTHPYYNWQHPVGAPDNVHSYYAGPDTVKPEITQVSQIRNRFSDRESYPVQTIIIDNLGIDSSAVYVHYGVKSRAIVDSVLLISSAEPGHFSGELPMKFSVGDTVTYRISARDISTAGNIGSSEWQSFMVGYENFETGLQSWQVEPNGWDVFRYGYTGKYSVCNSPLGFYPLNQDVSLTSKYGVDLSQTDRAVLTFWTAYVIEENKDFGFIEISSDSAATWKRLGTVFTGKNIDWKAASVSLSAFTGHGFNDVRIRFRFISDSTQSEGMAGWYIDDVRIISGIEVGITIPGEKLTLPQSFALYQNYPNPFNPSTTIEFTLPKSAFVTLKVYNLLGKDVATLIAEQRLAGIHKFIWDASGLASGVYLYRLEVGAFVQSKKLILMR